jgi:ATP-binding cassette subfamily B protein
MSKPIDLSEAVFQTDSASGTLGGGVLGVIWKMIARHKGKMWLAIVLGCLSSLMHILPAAGAGFVVYYLTQGDHTSAIQSAMVMMLGGFLMVIFFSLSTSVSHMIAANVQAEQRKNIADKLKTVPLGFFTRVSPIDLRRILIDDIEKLEDGVAHLIPEITAAYFGPLVLLVVMAFVDWRLAIAAFLPTILGFMVMSALFKKGVEITNKYYKAQAKITSTMGEVVKAIPVVKTYNNGDAALKRANESIKGLRTLINDWIEISVVPGNWFFLLSSSNLIFVTPLSIYLWAENEISLAILTFFHIAALSLALLISALFGVSTRLRAQESLVARWQALMTHDSLPVSETPKQPKNEDIVFENVGFSYDEKPLLEDINFTVKAGSSLALVGPSGSGKTTIARLLARFWDVGSGSIKLGDVDIREIQPAELTQHMSFVFQEIFLFSRSIKDNILIGKPGATDEEVIAAAKAARAHEFIQQLPDGYETVIDGSLSLSVGQKQRLSIARALLRNAPILVLDEATAFTDPENEYEVQQALSSLCVDKTLIVIAHRLSTIQNADQIIFINKGQIAERGTHAELLEKNGAYAAQWQTHMAAKTFQFDNADKAMVDKESKEEII